MAVKVLEFDISKAVTAKYKSKLFKDVAGCRVELHISDKAAAELKACKDSALDLRKLADTAKRAAERTASEFAKLLADLDKQIEKAKPTAYESLARGFNKEIDDGLAELGTELDAIVKAQWKRYLDAFQKSNPDLKSIKPDPKDESWPGELGKISTDDIEEEETNSEKGGVPGVVKAGGAVVVPGGASSARGLEIAVRAAARHVKKLRDYAVVSDKMRVKSFDALKKYILAFLKQRKAAHAGNEVELIEKPIYEGVYEKQVGALRAELTLWAAQNKLEAKLNKAVNDLLAQAGKNLEALADSMEKIDDSKDESGALDKAKKAVHDVQNDLETLTKSFEESTETLKKNKVTFVRVDALLLPLAARDPTAVLQRFEQNYTKIIKMMINVAKTTQLRLKSSAVDLKSIDKVIKSTVVIAKTIK